MTFFQRSAVLTLVVAIAPLSFAADEPPQIHPALWPASKSVIQTNKRLERDVDALLRSMTLEEKVGQIIQPSIIAITPDQVRDYHIGSVLNGGGGWPGDVRKAKPQDWLDLADKFYVASMDTSNGRHPIPIMWGADAVHGHNNIVGATIFPHNVGLGATRDPELIRRIGEVTAVEMGATGIDWNFSPTVAVARDDRWGRTYESYSEDPEIVKMCARNMILGLQGPPNTNAFLGWTKVIATSKHFIGDGGTAGGKDQGDNLSSEAELRDIHLAGYEGALAAGVQAVMASYNSWHGQKMHGYKTLLTDVLKKRMGFDGLVVGDWNGHGQLPGCLNSSCPQAINAGLDMFMVPEEWKPLYENTLKQVRSGDIPQARLDDAVRRVLRVKMRAGLFQAGKPSTRPTGGHFEQIGSRAHRDVARRAVRESLVLLKNNGRTLPLRPNRKVLVAGDGASNIPKQCGGWTLTWQGDGNTNADFPGGSTIWDGVRTIVERAGGVASLSADGSYNEKPDVAIVVFGEDPYAEFQGDRQDIVYSNARDLALVRKLHDAGIRVVSVFISGRPLWVNPYLNASDAFVAAWLPGTEGDGIAQVLFGDRAGKPRHDFRGKLAFSWPRLPEQVVLNKGSKPYDPLFPVGFGLTYAERVTTPQLPVDVEGAAGARTGVYVENGAAVAPWRIERPENAFLVKGSPIDLSREANGDVALAADVVVDKPVSGEVTMSVGSSTISVTPLVAGLAAGEKRTLKVRLRCFGDAGADLVHIENFRLSGEVRVEGLRLVPPSEVLPCPPK